MSFVVPMITQWSYSRLKTWEECPLKARLKFIQKLPEADSIHAARGTELHARAAAFIERKEEIPSLSPLSGVKHILESFRIPDGAAVVRTELQQGFDRQWNATTWFGPQVYGRVIYDLHLKQGPEVKVRDHKTGKIREEEHNEQLDLYNTAALATDETVEVSEAAIIYIDHNKESKPIKMFRSQLKERKEYWDERAGKMLADDIFAPRPNANCKWCHYRKTNGGPCQFG